MPIATFTKHHSCEKPDWKAKVRDHADALVHAIEDEYGVTVSYKQARAAVARAKKKLHTFIKTEDGPFVVWWEEDGKNFGVGEGRSVNDSSKYDNVWIELHDQPAFEEERKHYEAMSKKELIELLLEREALDPNGPP